MAGARGDKRDPSPSRTVRLPRFIVSEPTGLGDVVKRMTAAVGIQPCSACEQRAAQLNRLVQVTPRR